jgi:hypothetical protein
LISRFLTDDTSSKLSLKVFGTAAGRSTERRIIADREKSGTQASKGLMGTSCSMLAIEHSALSSGVAQNEGVRPSEGAVGVPAKDLALRFPDDSLCGMLNAGSSCFAASLAKPGYDPAES